MHLRNSHCRGNYNPKHVLKVRPFTAELSASASTSSFATTVTRSPLAIRVYCMQKRQVYRRDMHSAKTRTKFRFPKTRTKFRSPKARTKFRSLAFRLEL